MSRFTSSDSAIDGVRGPEGIQGIQGTNASEVYLLKSTTSIIDLQYHLHELRRLQQ